MKIITYLIKSRLAPGYILISALLLFLITTQGLSYAEHKAQDSLYQRPGLVNPEIYVIGIDERSQQELGQFSTWSRELMAEALRRLNADPDYRPAVIGVDVLYIGASGDTAADVSLVDAVAEGGNIVLASKAVFSNVWDSNAKRFQREVTLYERPFAELEAAAAACGLINATADDDGVVRWALEHAGYRDEYLPGFAAAIYRQLMGEYPQPPSIDNHFLIDYVGAPGDYYGSEALGFSFVDIFAEDFDPSFLADTILLIGSYAPGMLDGYYTPLSSRDQTYGIEIHANILQQMLEGRYKQPLAFLPSALLLLVMIALVIITQRFDIRITFIFAALLCACYILGARQLYQAGWVLPLLYPLLAPPLLFLYRLGGDYFLEAMEKQRIKNTFKKYVDPQLVETLIATGAAESNEVGSRRHLAVLFVDIRGFTPMTEQMRESPETIIKILNEYLELTTSAIFRNGGSVDKFVGDATMALFNGFVPLDDYMFLAVRTAYEMVSGAASANASLKEKYGVDVGFGVGVHCGEAIVGNIGAEFRKDYTAIGDAVNTAARLESNAKASQILISKDLYDALQGRIIAEPIGAIPLKGKTIPIEVYSVTGIVNNGELRVENGELVSRR